MTPSELKYKTQETNPYFFTRKTMKFFGDTMKNYGVRSSVVFDREGTRRNVWELYRKNHVRNGLDSSAYFDKVTFELIHIP